MLQTGKTGISRTGNCDESRHYSVDSCTSLGSSPPTGTAMRYEGPGESGNIQSGTLRANRLRLSEMDTRLAQGFRDAVARRIQNQATAIAPGHPYPPIATLDGDFHVNVVVPVRPGKHRELIFVIRLPEDPFRQFVYGTSKISVFEVHSESEIPPPSFEGAQTAREIGDIFIRRIREYIESGNFDNKPGVSLSPDVPRSASFRGACLSDPVWTEQVVDRFGSFAHVVVSKAHRIPQPGPEAMEEIRNPSSRSRIAEMWLLASENEPTNPDLWEKAKELAQGKRKELCGSDDKCWSSPNEGQGFKKWPSAYAVGWALNVYKELGGGWRKSKSARVAKGGLDEWFSGHGGGKPDERERGGDWVSISPVQNTVEREDGTKKTYEPGDIVGPCGISKDPDWKDVTDDGANPLKCMPREKAWEMSKKDRADLAKTKKKEEQKAPADEVVRTPTFSKESRHRVASAHLRARSLAAKYLFEEGFREKVEGVLGEFLAKGYRKWWKTQQQAVAWALSVIKSAGLELDKSKALMRDRRDDGRISGYIVGGRNERKPVEIHWRFDPREGGYGIGMNLATGYRYARSDEDKDRIFSEWREIINMTPSELDDWAEDDRRFEASLGRGNEEGIQSGRDSLHRIRRRSRKKREDWSSDDYDNAAQEIGFNKRMLGNEPGEPVGDTGMSKWEISLRNWGHAPSKSSSPANAKWKAWKSRQS